MIACHSLFGTLNIKIPTFNEFLTNFKDYKLNIEIKQHDKFIAKKLCESIKENQIQDNVVIGSFDDEVLDEFRYQCPDVATSPGRDEIRTFTVLVMFILINFIAQNLIFTNSLNFFVQLTY